MIDIFPGRREQTYTIWILIVSFSILVLTLMFNKLETELLDLFQSFHWVFIFLVPILIRVMMVIKYQKATFVQIEEAERNTTEHRGLFLTLSGFSFSALFALVLATTSSTANVQLLGTSILLMLVSFIMFYGFFTFEGFKYHRWQVDVIDTMSDIGKIALLLSLLAAIYSTSIDKTVKLTCLLFFFLFWLFSFLIHIKARYSYLSSFIRKEVT